MQFMIKPRRFLSCSDACLPRGSKTYPFWNFLCLYSTVGYERIKLLEFLLFMYIPMRKTEERVEERLVKKFSTAPLCSLPPPHESNTAGFDQQFEASNAKNRLHGSIDYAYS